MLDCAHDIIETMETDLQLVEIRDRTDHKYFCLKTTFRLLFDKLLPKNNISSE